MANSRLIGRLCLGRGAKDSRTRERSLSEAWVRNVLSSGKWVDINNYDGAAFDGTSCINYTIIRVCYQIVINFILIYA